MAVVAAGVATSFYSMKQEQEEAEEMYQAKWVLDASVLEATAPCQPPSSRPLDARVLCSVRRHAQEGLITMFL